MAQLLVNDVSDIVEFKSLELYACLFQSYLAFSQEHPILFLRKTK